MVHLVTRSACSRRPKHRVEPKSLFPNSAGLGALWGLRYLEVNIKTWPIVSGLAGNGTSPRRSRSLPPAARGTQCPGWAPQKAFSWQPFISQRESKAIAQQETRCGFRGLENKITFDDWGGEWEMDVLNSH